MWLRNHDVVRCPMVSVNVQDINQVRQFYKDKKKYQEQSRR